MTCAGNMISLRKLIASTASTALGIDKIGEQPVLGVTSNSQNVQPGFVFVALKGSKADGHDYVQDALDRGCIAAVVEEEREFAERYPLVKVSDSHLAYGQLAAAFFGNPARDMKIIGLTGTNGKTTTSWMIERVVQAGGGRPGVIGTVNYRYLDEKGQKTELDAPLTTPEPMQLQKLLRRMCDAGVTHLILEVSSHALSQQRVAGLEFDVAVFTNLSRDHLDYHQNMEEYFQAKKKLFDHHLKPGGVAVVALEPKDSAQGDQDAWGRRLAEHLERRGFELYPAREKKRTYMTCGLDNNCTLHAENVRENLQGSNFTLSFSGKGKQVQSGLIGKHNINNMLLAAATASSLGFNPNQIQQGLQVLDVVPGRLERVKLPLSSGSDHCSNIFVDYAHTPDALEHVLETLRQLTSGRLMCIFGCGGDRDQGKRPIMGSVAGRIADVVLLTSDNPRGENPDIILAEIEKGVIETGLQRSKLDDLLDEQNQSRGYALLEDRRQAIHHVCGRATKDDVILIAGKGHEIYQVSVSGKRYFDDRVEARNGILRWTADHLLAATSGQMKTDDTFRLLGKISTDTRTINPGDVFVALQGENFDGHDYVEKAVAKGAQAVVVHKECAELGRNVSVIHVKDTLKALGDIAAYRRRLLHNDVKVIAITGSSGKTTVKEMTAAIFDAEYGKKPGRPVLKTKGNLNNLIGLPLSLLNIDAGHRVAVMEMGMNRPGEIERLARIADPDIGCITNVQAAHLEGLGTIEGVARAKGELFAAMSDKGINVVNYDDPHVRRLGGLHGNNIVSYAVTSVGRRSNPVVRATRVVSQGEGGMRFTLHINTWKKRITIPATGSHNVANSAAAAAIATAAGVAPETIVKGLLRYRHGDKRMQLVDLPGGINVVNDSYNANPASMTAALQTVKGFGKDCRHVALLGDMFELGKSGSEAHRKIGKLAAELDYDYLGVTGEFAGTVADQAVQAGMQKSRVKVCKDKQAMAEWIVSLVSRKEIGEGDWLVIKGSRGMCMEQVLHTLLEQLNLNKN